MLTDVDLDREITYDSVIMKIRDLPTQNLRAEFGYGHFVYDTELRERHEGIGLYEPAECRRADEHTGVWINHRQNLVCPGCGLDFT